MTVIVIASIFVSLFILVLYLLIPAKLTLIGHKITISRLFHYDRVIDLTKIISVGASYNDSPDSYAYSYLFYYHTSNNLTQDNGEKFNIGMISKKQLSIFFNTVKKQYPSIEVTFK